MNLRNVSMDAITAAAMAVNEPLLKSAGMFLDNSWAYAIIILALVYLGEQRSGKRIKILFCLTAVLLFVMAIKAVMAVDRPCSGLAWCPQDHSFPSMHVAVAFALMIAFLDKKSFPFFFIFALFMSFTRMNIGVHTFRDVAGGLAVAVAAYYLTDLIWSKYFEKKGGRHG